MPERPKNIHAESDTMLDKSLPYKSIIMRMEAAVAERLAPGEAILLHTQTWSHRALRLYRSLGFRFCRTQTIVMRSKEGTGMKRYPNEFEEAMEVLRRTVAPAEIDEWRRTAFR